MNDNQFMGLRIKVENGELANSARQSIHGSPNKIGWQDRMVHQVFST